MDDGDAPTLEKLSLWYDELKLVHERLRDAYAAIQTENSCFKTTTSNMVDELLCPITQQLPVDPVMAEDGRVYDLWAIKEWIEKTKTLEEVRKPIWQRTSNEYFFAVFIALHKLLTAIGKRDARVEWDESWRQPACDGVRPPTWRHWLIDMIPSSVILTLASKQIAAYSAEVGHSLQYEIEYEANGPSAARSRVEAKL